MSTFVDNDGLRIEVLFSGNGVRAVSSQWATQGRVLHNGSLSLFGIVGEHLDLEFGREFGNKTLEREGCRDLEQCRTHWAARRASVVETLAREPPLSDREVYA